MAMMAGVSGLWHRSIARSAARRGAWQEATEAYRRALVGRPADTALLIQYGHAEKMAGRIEYSEKAYRDALRQSPADADAWLHLGHVLKMQGRSIDAADAFAAALRHRPDLIDAADELHRMGARRRIPPGLQRPASDCNSLNALVSALRHGLDALQENAALSIYSVGEYAAFRQALPVRSPPPLAPDRASPKIMVLIQADHAMPSKTRATLRSLRAQSHTGWAAIVRGPAVLLEHPLASMANMDERIQFVTEFPATASLDCDAAITTVAGILFDPQALAWFAFALLRTGCSVAYADADWADWHWRTGIVAKTPEFAAPFDTQSSVEEVPPAVLLVAKEMLMARALPDDDGEAWRRDTLEIAAAAQAGIVHIPRILSTRLGSPAAAGARRSGSIPDPGCSAGLLTVVIPTRDEGAMLKICVDSVLRFAARPEMLDIVIVDNRSIEPATADIIRDLTATGRVRSISMDEPFNWSRANALGVAGSVAEAYLFMNNDMEMLTHGWDQLLWASLLPADVGAIGARLLYPDGSVQHAGVLIGATDMPAIHEGVGAAAEDAGPCARLHRKRSVSAVTGAFLAVRRAVYHDAGGFDPALAVAYNDIDFCFRVRTLGMHIVYLPEIEIIHHESKTRGHNRTEAQIAWDMDELATFCERWPIMTMRDPGYNPHWAIGFRPFSELRDPSVSEILAHIDACVRSDPWVIVGP